MRTLILNALRMVGRRTAIGRHIEFLAQQWSRSEVPFDRVVFVSPRPVEISDLGTRTAIHFVSVGERLPNLLWEQVMLPRLAGKAAVLYCPSYTCPLLYRGRVVVANHGIYEALPGEFSWLSRLRATPMNLLSARRADHVIANSLSTQADLQRYFGIAEDRISVIYPAAHELCFQPYSDAEITAEVAQIFGQRVPYVIFVGKMAKRRHVPELIEAFSRVRREHDLPHRLLIIGPNTSGIPLDDLIEAAGGPAVVQHRPHMEMAPLAKLYAGADVYALPTTYEGISQTMFEAMASGTAVLTVEHPTLAEGGGDAVLALPTPSVDDLARGLERLLLDEEQRRSYSEKGRARAAKFSWAHTAAQTLAILDRVAPAQDRSGG